MAFKRLLKLTQRRPGRDRSPADGPAVDVTAIALDEPLGPPPVLRPAAIFRQLLFDPAESAPVWARPRSAPAPDVAVASGQTVDRPAVAKSRATGKARVGSAASTSEPTPTPAKRTRRPKASGPTTGESPAAGRTRSKRASKPSIDATEG